MITYEEPTNDCPLCRKSDYAGPAASSLSDQPVLLHYHGGNGKSRFYHYGCVLQAIEDALRKKNTETEVIDQEKPQP